MGITIKKKCCYVAQQFTTDQCRKNAGQQNIKNSDFTVIDEII